MSIEVIETNRAMEIAGGKFTGLRLNLSVYATDTAELSAPSIELLRRLVNDPSSEWSGVWERSV
jgi:hypothetical protein